MRVARRMSHCPSASLTKRIDSPSGEKTGDRSSSGVFVTWTGSFKTVSITQRSPPAMKAISRPSSEKATSEARSSIDRCESGTSEAPSCVISIFSGVGRSLVGSTR